MIIGQVMHTVQELVKTYYSPWMASGGNLAVISCEVIEHMNISAFDITVETKNSEDSDKTPGSPKDGSSNSITLSTETITKFNVGAKLSATGAGNEGFKELFRYKYELTGSDSSTSGFVHFRMLDPAWLTN